MIYTLCLVALAAVFVVRSLRVRARRQRERAREQAQLETTEGLPLAVRAIGRLSLCNAGVRA